MFDGADIAVQPYFVSPSELDRWAMRVRPHMARMAKGSGGRFLTDDLFAAVAAGRMQLWVAIDGSEVACVMLTEVLTYPRMRELRCIGLVGHQYRRWMHLLEAIEQTAKTNFGCKRISALHLPRFRHLLPDYEPTHILSEKDI